MTTSVADKTPIPGQTGRRHQDPPGLWFAVAISSASLHLLAFSLIRLSNSLGPWFPQPSQSAVPIELIDITHEAKSTNKPISPQRIPETAPTNSTSQDPEIVDSGSSQSENNDVAESKTPDIAKEQPTPSPEPEPSVSASLQPEPSVSASPEPEPSVSASPQPEPTPQPTVPVGEIPWKRREQIVLGEGKLLPSDLPSVTPEQIQESPSVEQKIPSDRTDTPTPENTNTPSENNSPTPTAETTKIPMERYTPTPTPESAKIPTEQSSPNPTASSTVGGAIATLVPLADSEARTYANDLPDVLSTYQGSSTKTVDSSYLPGDSTLKPAQLIASLVIDKNGNFQQAIVVKIEPENLQAEKSLYEQVINELFRHENFTPAHNRDGTKPDMSNLFVRINIEPTNRQ